MSNETQELRDIAHSLRRTDNWARDLLAREGFAGGGMAYANGVLTLMTANNARTIPVQRLRRRRARRN